MDKGALKATGEKDFEEEGKRNIWSLGIFHDGRMTSCLLHIIKLHARVSQEFVWVEGVKN